MPEYNLRDRYGVTPKTHYLGEFEQYEWISNPLTESEMLKASKKLFSMKLNHIYIKFKTTRIFNRRIILTCSIDDYYKISEFLYLNDY